MKHFEDPTKTRLHHVGQGEFFVERDPSVILSTTLGSCVATCIYDDEAKVGGMNHFLLPSVEHVGDADSLLGVNLMELLINNLIHIGADKRRLKAKLFGGGRVIDHRAKIGEKNARFARQFIADEGIPCISESLEGNAGRRIRFWPTTGRAQQIFLKNTHDEIVREPDGAPKNKTSDIELF